MWAAAHCVRSARPHEGMFMKQYRTPAGIWGFVALVGLSQAGCGASPDTKERPEHRDDDGPGGDDGVLDPGQIRDDVDPPGSTDGDGDEEELEDAGTSPDPDASDAGDSDPELCAAPDSALAPQGPNRALGAYMLDPEGCDSPEAEVPAKLNDGDDGTKWLCFMSTPAMGLAFADGATYAINTYSLTSGNDAPERDPKDFRLEGSNDGASWITVDQRSGLAFSERAETQTFYFENCQAFQRYRFVVEANNGDEGIFQVAELRLYGPAGESLPLGVAHGGNVTSSCPNDNTSEDAPQLFDANPRSKWFCGGQTSVTVAYQFNDDEAHAITRYSITAGNDSADRDPKAWTVEGSDDGVDWVALEPSQADQVFEQRYQTNTYSLDNGTAYKQYRLNVTANNGSVDFQVADFMLFDD
jgi:hypothetical protein